LELNLEVEMIIVTGGAGFIGSAIIWGLNQRGIHDILVVDDLGEDEKWKNLRSLKFADYLDKSDFLELVKSGCIRGDVETIFHLGACTDTTEMDAGYLLWNNYEYTKELALYAIKKGIRFIYASSAATYGDGSQGFSDDHEELERLVPINPYAYSKHLFDLWALRKGLLDKIAGLKYFNVYGPNEYHKGEMRSMVLKAYEQIKDVGYVRLFRSHRPDFRDGEQRRDFIYVKDAVRMTLFFMDNRDVNGIFNVGTGKARTFNDLVKAVFDALGLEPRIEYFDMPPELRDQYQYFTQAELDKLRAAGGPIETTPLEDAVREYVLEYLEKEAHLSSL